VTRTVDRFTARGISALTKPGLHADGGGLYVRVEPSGAKRFAILFQWRGRRKEMGLGSVLDITLAEAREAALQARRQVREGINPIDDRRRLRAAEGVQTFGELADQLVDELSHGWRSKPHKTQWRTSLTVDAAALRPLLLSQITTDDVLAVLQPIWHVKPESASRLRGRIERVLDAAKAKGKRSGENPARWKGHLSLLLSKRPALSCGHHAAMPYGDVAAFMRDLRGAPGISARALELTILTAARSSEVRFAMREEFDLDHAVWTVPAVRMKRKKLHRVALCPRAIEIVRQRIEEVGDGPLFPGQRRGIHQAKFMTNMAMPNLLPHLRAGQFTVHGFRSTFRDWAGDCTTFPGELAEAALHHAAGDAVEQAYRRGDALEMRRQLMLAWERFCAGNSGAVVVSMRDAIDTRKQASG